MKYSSLLGLVPLVLYLGVFTLVPVVSTLVLSFRTPEGHWGLEAFGALAAHYQFGEAVVNTLAITGLGLLIELSLGVASGVALLALAFAGPAAYSLAQLPVRWRYVVLLSLLLCRMLPEVSVALPIAVIFLRWGLLDTTLGLILAHLTMALPVAAWVLTTTFSSIPREVQEAAAIDGCGAWRTLTSIMLPLALPGLAVCGLLVWLLSWEEFTLATYLTLGAKTMPLQVYYYLYQGNWFDTAVAATLMTIPVLILSAFLQRYLRETSLAGVMR
jgi:trehalose transport system permease protein